MKLFLEKVHCRFTDSVNGQVVQVETDVPIIFEDEGRNWELVPSEYYLNEEFSGCESDPYVALAPDEIVV